jgi:hypothetical protein
MSQVVELFGKAVGAKGVDWPKVVAEQHCTFYDRGCYKTRKSESAVAIGTCTVMHGKKKPEPIIICPRRLVERGQIFVDCLHLLTAHEPGNELHLLAEVKVPGGNIDFVLVSAHEGKVKDFVGIELQTLDTSGSVWPVRQRLLRELGVQRHDNEENKKKAFGMNWKMTQKTILAQLHHKVLSFEHVNRKLVLVVQDQLLSNMSGKFQFGHMKNPAKTGDSMHIHSYRIGRHPSGDYRLSLDGRLSTDADGTAVLLGMQADARVELEQIFATLQARMSMATLFRPV